MSATQIGRGHEEGEIRNEMKRSLTSRIAVLAVSLEMLFIPGPPERVPSKALLCTVATDRSAVTAGSPLLARLALQNNSAMTLELTEPLDELYGTANVEIKRPGQKSFSSVPTAYTGLKDVEGYRSSLSKGETMAAYVLLLTDVRGRFVFDEAGRYELQARMGEPGHEAVSLPIAVEVKAADPNLQKRLESLRDDLSHVSLNEALDTDRLARLRRGLGNLPELENALLVVEAVTLIHRSSAAEQDKGAGNLRQLRDSGNAPWKELATALLARHFAKAGNTEEARRLLAEISHRSRLSDEARTILREVAARPEKRKN